MRNHDYPSTFAPQESSRLASVPATSSEEIPQAGLVNIAISSPPTHTRSARRDRRHFSGKFSDERTAPRPYEPRLGLAETRRNSFFLSELHAVFPVRANEPKQDNV